MQSKLTTKPEQEVIGAIQALDLEFIKLRMMDAELGEGWNREYANSVEAEYKNFLTMLVKCPGGIEGIPISKDVDDFWHSHILHTMRYADDCQNIFGNFLHHNPQTIERSSAGIQKISASAGNAAYCNATMRMGKTAYCNATVRADGAAYCNATVRADDAAYCNATMRMDTAAYCNATVRVDGAAYCNATVRTGNAAYCNAAIHGDKPAYCNATLASLAATV